MRTSHSSRRSFLSVLAACAATACAPLSRNSPFWGTMYAGIAPPEGTRLSRQYVDKLPYASMSAWFDGAPRALLVLASFEPEGRLIWSSAEGEAITTQGPFVVQAIGTEKELRGSVLQPPIGDMRRAGDVKAERTLDVWVDGERVQFAVESKFRAGPIDEIDILGRAHRLRRYIEAVRSGGKPRYRNEYWVDESDGFCWKSRQIVVPTMPHLNVEILKRPDPNA